MTRRSDLTELSTAHASGAPVVDVREPDEYRGGHIPGAMNLPVDQVAERLGEVPSTGPVYVVCASGKRSEKAAESMSAAGIDAVWVKGGTKGWIEAGHPVTDGSNP